MTLPAAFPLSMSQVATELGLPLPLSMNHAWILALADKTALPLSLSDLLGKSGRVDGAFNVNSNGSGGPETPFTFFGGQIWQIGNFGDFFVNVNNGISLPSYLGPIQVINHTTGVTTRATWSGFDNWINTSPPANCVALGQANNVTIIPST